MTAPLFILDPNELQPRGVYRAPCLSPDRELIIYAVDHNHCVLRDPQCVYVKPGDNLFTAWSDLWDRLNEQDPVPDKLSKTG